MSPSSTTPRTAMAEVFAAAVLFGTTGTARVLGAPHANPLGVGAARLAVGGAALAALARWGRGRHGTTVARAATTTGLLLLAGALTALYQLAFFAGLDRVGVAVGTVVTIGSGPPLAGVIGMLAGHGRPSPRWLGATTLAVAGVALLAGRGSSTVRPAGVALALLSGLGYAGYTVVAKELIDRGVPGRAVLAWAFGLGGVLMLPALVATGPGWLAQGRGALTALYLGLVPTAFAYVLFARGLVQLSAATVTTIVLAEPLVATLLGVVVLDERLTPVEGAGCALVLGGLALIATSTGRGSPPTGARRRRPLAGLAGQAVTSRRARPAGRRSSS